MNGFRRVALVVAVLTAGVPLAAGFSLALLPLWRWLESATGIEAVGHSGPASWCYLVVYATLLAAIWLYRAGRRG